MSNPIPTISATSPPSPHSSPSSRPNSPTRPGLRRPASHGRLAKLMLPGRSRASSSASASNEVVYADDNSPNASGRTTPEQRRRTGKAAATSLLASDARYKKLALAVDKSLASFESVNEWADFISFLSRLLKVRLLELAPWARAEGLDIAIRFSTFRRNPSQAHCLETSSSMLESGTAIWSSPASARRLRLYLQHDRRESFAMLHSRTCTD
jgi:hypothetical protein